MFARRFQTARWPNTRERFLLGDPCHSTSRVESYPSPNAPESSNAKRPPSVTQQKRRTDGTIQPLVHNATQGLTTALSRPLGIASSPKKKRPFVSSIIQRATLRIPHARNPASHRDVNPRSLEATPPAPRGTSGNKPQRVCLSPTSNVVIAAGRSVRTIRSTIRPCDANNDGALRRPGVMTL